MIIPTADITVVNILKILAFVFPNDITSLEKPCFFSVTLLSFLFGNLL